MASRLLPPSAIRRPSRLLALRHGSGVARLGPADLAEPEPGPPADVEDCIRRLEDAVHELAVRRAAPTWLPLLPGSSYWAPPRRRAVDAGRIARLVERIADPPVEARGAPIKWAGGYLAPGLPMMPQYPFEGSTADRSIGKSDDDDDG